MSREVGLLLFGYGRVGRQFASLVTERREDVRRRYGVDLRLAAIREDAQQLLVGDGVPPRADWPPIEPLGDFLGRTGAAVAVQAIPSSEGLRSVALEQALASIGAGMDLVSATKSHLVYHWRELAAAAEASGRRIRISAATGAALPAADVARVSLRGFPCGRIRGCLNGTSSFVLERLEQGATLAEAVETAQQLGIAEPDPRGDLTGADAASKIVLLANVLWNLGATMADVEREPIDEGTRVLARRAVERGRRIRAVARAEAMTRTLCVELEEVVPDDPLYHLRGPEKAVQYDCGEVGQIVVSGGKSSPLGAAHAMLKDTLELVLGRAGEAFA